MDCEHVREEFVERLTGTLDPERSKAIDEHLAGCAACRTETDRMRELWKELGTLRVPTASGAAGRVSRMIDARAGAVPEPAVARRNLVPRIAIAATALAASLLAGVVVGQRSGSAGRNVVTPPPNTGAAAKEQYVLLLHGPAQTASRAAPTAADSAAARAIVAEYRAWAIRLQDAGALVLAEKLADDPLTMLTASGAAEMPHNTPEELGGFFLIQVADSAEAFRIARDCPHLKYGGTVQVRRIEPT